MSGAVYTTDSHSLTLSLSHPLTLSLLTFFLRFPSDAFQENLKKM